MLRLVVIASGEEYFELNKEGPAAVLSTKNHTGGLDGSEDHPDGKICPVQTIKSYIFHLNPGDRFVIPAAQGIVFKGQSRER